MKPDRFHVAFLIIAVGWLLVAMHMRETILHYCP